jgi:hypothetical protein
MSDLTDGVDSAVVHGSTKLPLTIDRSKCGCLDEAKAGILDCLLRWIVRNSDRLSSEKAAESNLDLVRSRFTIFFNRNIYALSLYIDI